MEGVSLMLMIGDPPSPPPSHLVVKIVFTSQLVIFNPISRAFLTTNKLAWYVPQLIPQLWARREPTPNLPETSIEKRRGEKSQPSIPAWSIVYQKVWYYRNDRVRRYQPVYNVVLYLQLSPNQHNDKSCNCEEVEFKNCHLNLGQ